jgi:hypothetical protein
LALALFIASADARTSDPVYGMPRVSSRALHAAVLAQPPVQGDERQLDPLLSEDQIEIAVDVDRLDLPAPGRQGRDHRLAAAQGHLALARHATQQDADRTLLHGRDSSRTLRARR